MKKRTRILIAFIIVLIAAAGIFTAAYSNDYYRAVGVENYLKDGDGVTVSKIKEGYFFDGCGEDSALIFYPGAKVEETAYAPMMKTLAENGVDCFLIKMPFKLAFMGMNRADAVRNEYSYKNYYLAGHSLGGAMAANFVCERREDYNGLFLLAAYPTKDLSDTRFPIVLLYGENDRVLNRKKLKKGYTLMPKDVTTVEIKGGNHADFGCYGKQDGDGKAAITKEEQQKITTDAILQTVNK